MLLKALQIIKIYARFFDLPSGRSLHLWQCDLELSGSSLVSAIASSGSNHHINGRTDASSWISMGFGLGQCRLLDLRSGNFVSSWKAHDNFITKVGFLSRMFISLDELSTWYNNYCSSNMTVVRLWRSLLDFQFFG